MSAASAANMPFWVHPAEHKDTKYRLCITRLVFIDTAEESAQWLARAKQQWGSNKPIAIRVTNETNVLGTTVAKSMASDAGWTGIDWSDVDDDNSDKAVIEVPSDNGCILVLEVVGLRGTVRDTVYGTGILNYAAMVAEKRQYAKYCVHLFPTQTTIDAGTVFAMLEAEIHTSAWDGHGEDTFSPLEYNFGSVRVSTLDFYFPSFALTGGGDYVVSNVMCAMNMTENSALAMQLFPLRGAQDYIMVEPRHVITVQPQQRVYFSATWNVSERACMRKLEVQLLVNGAQPPSAPVLVVVHNSPSHPKATGTPFHYWINTTCLSNRQFSLTQELPLVRALLPVFRFATTSGSTAIATTATATATATAATATALAGGEGVIVALDKDRGESVLVRADGVPVASAAAHCGAYGGDGPLRLDVGLSGLAIAEATGALQRSVVNGERPFAAYDGPMLNLSQKTCQCVIHLGTIRGLPMVYEVLTGVSPSFQVSVTLLDKFGWQVVRGETQPSYLSASGSLHWDDELILRKWPGASANQFVRLNLIEVRPCDGDTTPIGAALVSLFRLDRTAPQVGVQIAFHVYETYSLYDTLHTSSLLMKNAFILFSELAPDT